MKYIFTIGAFILLLISTTSLKANEDFYLFGGSQPENFPGDTYIENFYPFQGDKHGDFRGDIVIYLADGSAWKGHPNDQKRLSRWEPGDFVHISLRTSSYWFKREHKFLLNNHSRKETVKVMLVDHGPQPLMICSISEIYYTEVELIPVWGWNDNDEYTILYYDEEPIYKQNITLSDGSGWIIHKNFSKFLRGAGAYIGFDEFKNQFFLIVGQEREAVWSYTDPGAVQIRR